MKDNDKFTTIAIVAALLAAAVLSYVIGPRLFAQGAFLKGIGTYLDEKRNTVMEISAASTAASAAITMLPGDVATPIADKLADLSTYSLLVLCAIFLEKYLAAITGSLAFKWLIPIACFLLMCNLLFFKSEKIRKFAFRLGLLGIITFAVIPVSVHTSKMIDQTYETSIAETIEQAKESTQEIQNNAQDSSILDQFISTFNGGVSGILNKFERVLNNFVEAIAVMIVTSFIIPVIVLIFFVFIAKNFLENISGVPNMDISKFMREHMAKE